MPWLHLLKVLSSPTSFQLQTSSPAHDPLGAQHSHSPRPLSVACGKRNKHFLSRFHGVCIRRVPGFPVGMSRVRHQITRGHSIWVFFFPSCSSLRNSLNAFHVLVISNHTISYVHMWNLPVSGSLPGSPLPLPPPVVVTSACVLCSFSLLQVHLQKPDL